MLAAHDQENLVHSHQAAAAAKPLNHGPKQLQFKTPTAKAPKTPFKIPLNDENATNTFNSKFPKSTKGNAFQMTGGKSGATLDKNAFVTPMGTRPRAPLGMKTTNAKAKNFETPVGQTVGNGHDKVQQRSATSRKVKPRHSHLEVVKPSGVENVEDADVPDIEYMPPRPKDIEDYPDEFLQDMDYSHLRGANLTRGWYQTYCNPVGADGLTRYERQEKEARERHEKEVDQMIMKAFDEMTFDLPELAGSNISSNSTTRPETENAKRVPSSKSSQTGLKTRRPLERGPSTLRSKAAASALSQQRPVSAASTASQAKPQIKAKLPRPLMNRPKQAPTPTNPSSMRHNAAKANSHSTIGYTRGRATSISLRNKNPAELANPKTVDAVTSSEHKPVMHHFDTHRSPEAGSDEWHMLRTYDTPDDDDDDGIEDALKGLGTNLQSFDEDAAQDFVLTL